MKVNGKQIALTFFSEVILWNAGIQHTHTHTHTYTCSYTHPTHTNTHSDIFLTDKNKHLHTKNTLPYLTHEDIIII